METLHRKSDAYRRDYNVFVTELKQFHQNRGTAFRHTPRINGREVDLYLLYNQVTALGGWQKVTDGHKWEGILESLKLPVACANSSLAIRQIYIRYLGHYEKGHFLGEDPDEDNHQTPESRSRKHQSSSMHNVPMAYNYAQHEITEFQRTAVNLNQKFVYPNDYNKLCLSLLSGLPNEQDFALNICTLLCNEGRHVLHLEKVPKLLDLLVAQAGVFPERDSSLANVYRECWEGVPGRQMSHFWLSNVNLADPDVVDLLLASCGVASVEKREDELFNLDDELGVQNSEGQRVLRIALILYNLSFEKHNIPVLASSSSCQRFLLLCVNCRWAQLCQVALDILGNLAGQIVISLKADLHSRLMLRTVSEGVDSNDRFVVLRSLEILAHLAQQDKNDEVLSCCVDLKVFQRIMALLTIHDIMLLVYSLETLYSLSELGRKVCEKILRVHKSVATLVSLLTLDPQISGPGEGNFKLVETFETTSVATNIPTSVVGPAVTNVSSVGAQGATQPIATPVPLHNPGPMKPAPVQRNQLSTQEVDSESFACHWLRSAYEVSQGSAVSRNELYAEYVSHCSKVGKKCVVNANVFANCVRNVFPQTVPKKAQIGSNVALLYHNNIRQKPVIASRIAPSFTQGTGPLLCNVGQPPRTPSPRPVLASTTTGGTSSSTSAASVGGSTTGARSGHGSHSPILKAQLSAPLRSMTPPLTPTSVSPSPPPSPSPTLSPNTNLIKTLLASKVTRNIQKNQQDTPISTMVTNGTPVSSTVLPVTTAVNHVVSPVRVAVPVVTLPNRVTSLPNLSPNMMTVQVARAATPKMTSQSTSTTTTTQTTMAAFVLTPKTSAVASVVTSAVCSTSVNTHSTTVAASSRLNKDIIIATMPNTCTPAEVPVQVLNARLNGMTKDIRIEVCDDQTKEASALGETTPLPELTVENVQNHLNEEEEDEGSSNDSFDPLTMLGLRPPKAPKRTVIEETSQLPNIVSGSADITDDDQSKQCVGQDRLYKSSPLLNGLLDKGSVPLPGEEATMLTNGNREATEGSNEVESVQYVSAPEAIAGGTRLLIARTLDQQQIQPQHIQILQNSNGGAPNTTPIAILNMADFANQATSDLSSISDIARTLECASKAISRTNVECNTQLPILAVPASAAGGTTHIVSVLRISPQGTITLPVSSGQQQFVQTHIVRLPAPTVTLKMEDASELMGLPQIASNQLRNIQFKTTSNNTVAALSTSGEVVQASLKRPPSTAATGGSPTCIILEAKRPRTEVKNVRTEKVVVEENSSAAGSVVKANFQEQRFLLPKPRSEESKTVPVQSKVLIPHKNVSSPLGVAVSRTQFSTLPSSSVSVAYSVGSGVVLSSSHSVKPQTITTSVLPASTPRQSLTAASTSTTPVKRLAVSQVGNVGVQGKTAGVAHFSGKLAGVTTVKDSLAYGEIKGQVAPGRIHFTCDWRNCHRKFVSPGAVFLHVQKTHMPAQVTQEALCEWENCDKMKRKKLSLLTHVQDRHCNEQLMQMQALRKQQVAQFGKSSIPPPQPPPLHPGYAPDAALLAVRRHALQFMALKEPVEEKEGPLTKSIRLTAALVLRNLVFFCPSVCSQLRQHEPELAALAMSTVESSRTISQCLLELARPAGQHN